MKVRWSVLSVALISRFLATWTITALLFLSVAGFERNTTSGSPRSAKLATAIASQALRSSPFISPSGLSAPQSSVSTPCLAEQLSVRHISDDAAMGGARSVIFAFTNTSSAPCALSGYPRFELLTKSGRPVRGGRVTKAQSREESEQTEQSPPVVTLAPGQRAWFQINYNSGGAGHLGKPCPVSPKVRITAPGTERGFVLREVIQACNYAVEVSAIQSGLPE